MSLLENYLSPSAYRRLQIEKLKYKVRSLPDGWQNRIHTLFGAYFWHPFSQPHIEMWEWADAITKDNNPRPFVAAWPRGRGKSTNAEAVAADAGVRQVRTYCMYCCGTQDQADKHVQTIARMLERNEVAEYRPNVGQPRISNNGNRTWNRKMLSTASGYTVEAIGLNKAIRGQKIDWARPDLIVFDDIDEKHDTPLTTSKKKEIITDSILPAGSSNCAVLFVQNLIHSNSIATKLIRQSGEEDAASYLMDRIISGPFKAVDGLVYEQREVGDRWRWIITGGKSLWEGYTLSVCEDEINRVGPTSFERESQHEFRNEHSLFANVQFKHIAANKLPDMVRTVVVVDPATTSTDESDSHGISVSSIDENETIYHRHSIERIMTPYDSIERAILLAIQYGSLEVFVETNTGGDTWEYLFSSIVVDLRRSGRIVNAPSFFHIKATAAIGGKIERAQGMLGDYERGAIYHVIGTHETLEAALLRFPQEKPFDLVDATVYAHQVLREGWTQLLL